MTSKRLLIVDDALLMRKRIRSIAEEVGWQTVDEAANGHEAIECYANHRPDLVTLDIVMPSLDGVETLRKIIEMDSDANVVMVSAINQKSKLNECIQIGAMDFIVKPFQKRELAQFLERRLKSDQHH